MGKVNAGHVTTIALSTLFIQNPTDEWSFSKRVQPNGGAGGGELNICHAQFE